ncbi:MAG: hypothetical protein ACLFQL_09895 [Paracoccaceae bacterium]
MRHAALLALLAGLAACDIPESMPRSDRPERPAEAAADPAGPEARPEGVEADGADAAATREDGALGRTVASLGDPAEPGLWLETPLVTAQRPGRVELAGTGRSAEVELRPSGGAAGSGSRVSLDAMRALDAPLTGLPELQVFAR